MPAAMLMTRCALSFRPEKRAASFICWGLTAKTTTSPGRSPGSTAPQTPAIALSFEHGNAEIAAQALNTLVDQYLARRRDVLAPLVAQHNGRIVKVMGDGVLVVGDLRIDPARRTVTVGDRAVDLTPKEFAFLVFLARNPGRVLTHHAILQEVWGPNYGTETQYLRVYAGQIRKKLDDDMRNPRLVTDLGVGYRLQARSEPSP